MSPFQAQVAQQSPAICSLPGDAHRAGGAAASHIAAAMVEDEPVAAPQAGFGQQRPEGVRDECPVDEYRGLASSRYLVLQFSPVGSGPFQPLPPSRHPGGIGECCRSLLFGLILYAATPSVARV